MKLICPWLFLIVGTIFQFGCIETRTGSEDPSQSDSVTADRTDSEAKKPPNLGKVHIVAEKKFPSQSDPFGVMEASSQATEELESVA